MEDANSGDEMISNKALEAIMADLERLRSVCICDQPTVTEFKPPTIWFCRCGNCNQDLSIKRAWEMGLLVD